MKPSRAGYNVLACQSEPCIILQSSSACGRCQYDEFNAHWTSRIEEARTAYNETQQRLACNSDSSCSVETSDRVHNEDGLSQLKDLAEELENLTAAFETASWQIRQRFPPYKREPYTSPAQSSRISSLSRLRMEINPDEVVTDEEQHWALESENLQLHFTGHATFQSFFMDKYGLWGPEVDLPTVIAEAESNRSGDPELEPRSLALIYGPDAPEGDTIPSLEDAEDQDGRIGDATSTNTLAQGIAVFALGPDAPNLDDDSGSTLSDISEATTISSSSVAAERAAMAEPDKSFHSYTKVQTDHTQYAIASNG